MQQYVAVAVAVAVAVQPCKKISAFLFAPYSTTLLPSAALFLSSISAPFLFSRILSSSPYFILLTLSCLHKQQHHENGELLLCFPILLHFISPTLSFRNSYQNLFPFVVNLLSFCLFVVILIDQKDEEQQMQQIQQKEQLWIPEWLDRLLSEEFFAPCSLHRNYRRNAKTIFCIDCQHSLCSKCLLSHSPNSNPHRLLRVRRNVYHDVIRLDDAEKLLDCSRVQV